MPLLRKRWTLTSIKKVMHKKVPLILLWLSVSALLVYYFFNFYQLISRAYYVNETELIKVDTFQLYTRAFRSSDGGGGKSHSESKLIFEDVKRNSFAIDGGIFQAITDEKKLEDTLMYHNLKFTVFSDKDTYNNYTKSKVPIFIRVYQIQIGDTKYIDINRMNDMSKRKIMRGIIIPPAFVFFFGFLLYKENKDENWWTKRRVRSWCIAFFLTTIALLCLT